jgi:hypothetical protein
VTKAIHHDLPKAMQEKNNEEETQYFSFPTVKGEISELRGEQSDHFWLGPERCFVVYMVDGTNKTAFVSIVSLLKT